MGGLTFNFWNSVADIFYILTIYFFYETILTAKEKVKNRIYYFVIYWMVLTVLQIYPNLAWVSLLVNITFGFMLTCLYDSGLGRRILAAIFIFSYLFSLEVIGMITIMGILSYSLLDHGLAGTSPTAPAPVSVGMVSLASILVYRKIKQHKEETKVPVTYWIAIFLVPLSSIYITLLIFSFSGARMWQQLSTMMIMIAVTVSVFVLYEKQVQFYTEENRKRILEVQNNYYKKQLDYVLVTENATRTLRHDMKNHLLAISALAEKSNIQEIADYVNQIYDFSELGRNRVSSGNVIIDSILNHKLVLAEEKGIEMKVDITIPEAVELNDIDVTILLGNLLDNAIENVEKANEKRVLILIRYDKGRIFICCENPYNGIIKRRGNVYDTVKHDRKNHGMGLKSIKGVVEKYDGTMNILDENNLFRVEILLYVPK